MSTYLQADEIAVAIGTGTILYVDPDLNRSRARKVTITYECASAFQPPATRHTGTSPRFRQLLGRARRFVRAHGVKHAVSTAHWQVRLGDRARRGLAQEVCAVVIPRPRRHCRWRATVAEEDAARHDGEGLAEGERRLDDWNGGAVRVESDDARASSE